MFSSLTMFPTGLEDMSVRWSVFPRRIMLLLPKASFSTKYALGISKPYFMRLPRVVFINSPTFFKKTIDKSPQKCGASRPLINKVIRSGAAGTDFLIGGDFIETF